MGGNWVANDQGGKEIFHLALFLIVLVCFNCPVHTELNLLLKKVYGNYVEDEFGPCETGDRKPVRRLEVDVERLAGSLQEGSSDGVTGL